MSTIQTTDPFPAIARLPETEMTLDDLLAHPESDHYELVDGRLVELNIGIKSSRVALAVGRILEEYCVGTSIAYAFSELGYACFPGKQNRVRRPDLSVVLVERMPPAQFEEGFSPIRPDLAIEIISPNDRVDELEDKLDDYREVGVPLVWIIRPSSRRVRVIRLEGPPTELGPGDELTGETLLPGLRCRVADLFGGLPVAPSDPPR